MSAYTVVVKGDKIVVTIDANAPRVASKSGKSQVVATTNGFAPVPGTDLRLNLNLIAPK